MRIGVFFKFLGRSIAIGATEFLVVARWAPLRPAARRLKRAELRALAPHFDRATYLRQIRSAHRRRRAAFDPALHYLLIGWLESRAPNLRFDPVFRGDDMRADAQRGEPLLNLLSRPDWQSLPQNEIEMAAPLRTEAVTPGATALIFHHSRGGGSSKFLAAFEANLRRSGIRPVRLRLLPKSDRLVVWPGDAAELIDVIDEMPKLIARAKREAITHLVVSHLIDFDASLVCDRMRQLADALDVRPWVILHDYLFVCARVTPVDSLGHPCAIPPTTVCTSCVARGGSQIGSMDPGRWRTQSLRLLDAAERIFVPSEDARERMSRFVAKPIEIWRPQADNDVPAMRVPRLDRDQKLAVAVIGSLNEAKGARVLVDLARHVGRTSAPVTLTVYGETDHTRKLRAAGVAVVGRYRDDEIGRSLSDAAPHLVLMPAIWPETWSFILTTALERGFPVMAFAHGAQSERLRALGREDMLMPIEWFDRPDLILGKLLAFRDACMPSRGAASSTTSGESRHDVTTQNPAD